MKFSYRLIPQLPPLAWVARGLSDTSTISVSHGRFVETHPHFFVEGAWAGEFEAGRIQDADTVFGSGGCLADGCVTFASCTATTDFLYHSDDSGHFIIANSLPLLLAVLDDALQPGRADYSLINRSILGGIRGYRAHIPTRKGHVSRVMHSNVQFGPDGIILVEKPLPPHFQQFGEYRDFMRNRIAALFANARHPGRRNPMQIFSTQSKGYDSTAVNALAAPYGIDKVFTSPQSKERRSFYLGGGKANLASDDGTPVGEALGLACIPIDRLGFRQNLLNEHLYWAGLDNNQDLNLHGIQSFISSPTLLLTGNLGEIWYTSEAIGQARLPTVNDELIRWDQAGHGLSEVRLAAGMVQVAVPFIGARSRKDILDITEAAAMDAFRLGGGYDRPIARRIAEEAGVPRTMFGQTKLASIVHMPSPNVPVTPPLRAEFFRHLRSNHLLGHLNIGLLPLAQRINNWIYWNKPSRYFNDRRKHPLLGLIGYGWSRLSGQPLRIHMLWPQLDSYLYAFCVNKLRSDYAGQLAASQTVGVETDTTLIPAPISGVQE